MDEVVIPMENFVMMDIHLSKRIMVGILRTKGTNIYRHTHTLLNQAKGRNNTSTRTVNKILGARHDLSKEVTFHSQDRQRTEKCPLSQ